MKRLFVAVVALLAVCCHIPAQAQQEAATQHKLLGTWKLLSVTSEAIPSGAKTELMGSNPSGYINYGADGRMMVLIVRGDRKKPAGAMATPEEKAALFGSMISYAGTYTIAGDTITHHVDISWNQSWTGTSQSRLLKFEGNRLILSTQPSPDPVHGKMSIRSLVWEKVK